MTNAEQFKKTFGIYAEGFWSYTEKQMLDWINTDVPDINVGDMISRQAAIDALVKAIREDPYYDSNEAINGLGVCDVRVILNELPSAQPDVHDRNVGEWDMFDLITSAYYGKLMYSKQDNGIVYSRYSCKYMSMDEAIREFLALIGETYNE